MVAEGKEGGKRRPVGSFGGMCVVSKGLNDMRGEEAELVCSPSAFSNASITFNVVRSDGVGRGGRSCVVDVSPFFFSPAVEGWTLADFCFILFFLSSSFFFAEVVEDVEAEEEGAAVEVGELVVGVFVSERRAAAETRVRLWRHA